MLINCNFLTNEMLNYQKHVKQKVNFIKIRDIENINFNTIEYLLINFRILNTIVDDNLIIINFIKHFYVVDNLKIKILLSNNILEFEQIILNIFKKQLIIESC